MQHHAVRARFLYTHRARNELLHELVDLRNAQSAVAAVGGIGFFACGRGDGF